MIIITIIIIIITITEWKGVVDGYSRRGVV